MAQSIRIAGATYSNVPAIDVPKSTSGTARFVDTSPTTAVASDVASGKIFFDSSGIQQTGSASGGGGGGGLTLLKTQSLGSISTTSTSAVDLNKSVAITGYDDYDLLIIEVKRDTSAGNYHVSTVSTVYNTSVTKQISLKGTYTVGSNKWNSTVDNYGIYKSRQSTTSYGVYVNSVSVSEGTMTIALYGRYNSNNTKTINGSYTAKVYGLKFHPNVGA